MRVGVLTLGEAGEMRRLAGLGFGSMEWVRFADGPCGPAQTDWKPHAEELAAAAQESGVRISAIAALYANPLHPAQSQRAVAVFERAITVAAHLGVKTVAGFPGAIIETEWSERGGAHLWKPFDAFLPELVRFWEPLARLAADHGVRIAFEHCPQGRFHLPVMGYNMLAQPAMWERLFNECRCENLGIEWDPGHLVCQFIDPVENIRRFGPRIFHVHAKDAFINQRLLAAYGICHPGVAEHRMPGFGQSNWAEIIHALVRAGYDSDLNIEGWHDPVFRDHPEAKPGEPARALAGRKLEEAGLLAAKRHLEQYTLGT